MNQLAMNFKQIFKKHPIARGMITYAITWSASSVVQQTMETKTLSNYDCWRIIRYGIYGGLIVAPTVYWWIKLAAGMYPGTNLRVAIAETAIETISYSPFSIVCFFYVMTLMEGKSFEAAKFEVYSKFLPSFKIASTVWPAVAIINYGFIQEKNRVLFISICSFIWSTYLACMIDE